MGGRRVNEGENGRGGGMNEWEGEGTEGARHDGGTR